MSTVLCFLVLSVVLPYAALSALRTYGNPPVRNLSHTVRVVSSATPTLSRVARYDDFAYFASETRPTFPAYRNGWGPVAPITVRDHAGNVIGSIVL